MHSLTPCLSPTLPDMRCNVRHTILEQRPLRLPSATKVFHMGNTRTIHTSNTMKGAKTMKRILVLTLVLVMLASPASALLRVLEPSVALELETIARNSIATERNIPLAQVTAVDPWLLDLRGLAIEIYVVPLVIGQEKITVNVRVSDKAILTEKEVEALKAKEVAHTGLVTLVTDVALPEAAGVSTLTYALVSGLVALALGTSVIVLRKRRR